VNPQAPQLRTSVEVSTQVATCGGFGQASMGGFVPVQTQAPELQVPIPQVLPHPPQFAASVWSFTHWPRQTRFAGALHVQTPATQSDPALQLVPQAPQLRLSVWVFVQPLPQLIVPAAQVGVLDVQLATAAATTSASSHPPRAMDLANLPAIGRLPGVTPTVSGQSSPLRCTPGRPGRVERPGRRPPTASRHRRGRAPRPACAGPTPTWHA